MKEKIQQLYVQALLNESPPNVFADEVLSLFDAINSISMHDLMLYYHNPQKFDFTSKAIDVLNSYAKDRQGKCKPNNPVS